MSRADTPEYRVELGNLAETQPSYHRGVAISLSIEPPRQAEVEALLAASTAYARSLYPPEHCFLLDVASLEEPAVAFYVARDEGGEAVGIAALVDTRDGSAELKRMFVAEAARGRGVGRSLIRRMEDDAALRGIRRIVLETGDLHDGAQALYRSTGFSPIAPFGQYVGEPHSVCFAKNLTRTAIVTTL